MLPTYERFQKAIIEVLLEMQIAALKVNFQGESEKARIDEDMQSM